MFAKVLALAALLALGACGAAKQPYAPDEAVAAARYVAEGPKSITLFTVVNVNSGGGAHSGLLINGSERVLFDPAGSFQHPRLPERNDVHYGINDKMVAFYIDYHARVTYNVVEQTVIVSPQVAEMVLARAKAYGAVPKSQCAHSISSILQGVPGFDSIPATWFPNKLSEGFGQIPGATRRVITDDDADDNHGVLLVDTAEERDAILAAQAAAAN